MNCTRYVIVMITSRVRTPRTKISLPYITIYRTRIKFNYNSEISAKLNYNSPASGPPVLVPILIRGVISTHAILASRGPNSNSRRSLSSDLEPFSRIPLFFFLLFFFLIKCSLFPERIITRGHCCVRARSRTRVI